MATQAKKETFKTLCKKLGDQVRASSVENALLCYRAYQAYLVEYPDTAHGKARANVDRDPSFRVAAAEESGVSASTIDALLQVGKAIQSLPKAAQRALVSSSLQDSVRLLRQLAVKKYEKKRANLITAFARKEATDPAGAMRALKKSLGLDAKVEKTPKRTSGGKERSKASLVIKPETQQFAPGEWFDVEVDGYIFRVAVGEIVDGQICLTAMAVSGEKSVAAKLLASVSAEHPATTSKSAKRAPKLAA